MYVAFLFFFFFFNYLVKNSCLKQNPVLNAYHARENFGRQFFFSYFAYYFQKIGFDMSPWDRSKPIFWEK